MKFSLLAISTLIAIFIFTLISNPILAQSDTLMAQVDSYPGPSGRVLKGQTRDLSLLDIRTLTINAAIMLSGKPDSVDELLIVKEGDLNITVDDSTTTLDPGGVALIPAGLSYSLEAKQSTYFRFRFQTRRPRRPNMPLSASSTSGSPASASSTSSSPMSASFQPAPKPFILRWSDMPVEKTAKGETREILSLHTPWLTEIDLHATTLSPGEVSHLPHTHRAEEIILMRTGHVQEYIDGKHYPAMDGDLLFLPSGSSHAVENHGTVRCQYFALQWLP